MFKFIFYTIVWKTKLSGVGLIWLDSGREPNLSGSESDMYTVYAQSKICPCMPPRTHPSLFENVFDDLNLAQFERIFDTRRVGFRPCVCLTRHNMLKNHDYMVHTFNCRYGQDSQKKTSLKKKLKNSKLENINQKWIVHLPVIYVTTNDDHLKKKKKKKKIIPA